MTSPRTWSLIQAVETCLQRIKVADGYRTNAGATVSKEPEQTPTSADETLMTIVLDSLSRPEDPAARKVSRYAGVAIYAKVACDLDNAQRVLHDMLEDIDSAMALGIADFPVGITFPQFLDAQAIPAAEGMKWTGAVVRYRSTVRLR